MTKWYPSAQQMEGVQFLLERHAGGLFWVPGRGKTATGLAVLQTIKHQQKAVKCVVISTPNIINNVWKQEIAKWGFDLSFTRVTGLNPDQREDLLQSIPDTDILGVNFQILKKCCQYNNFIAYCQNAVLIVDESQHLSNPNGENFKALRYHLPKFARRYIFTGTPRSEGLMGLWSQAFIMDLGQALQPRVGLYRELYFERGGYGGYSWELRKKSSKKIRKKIAPLVHRADYKGLNMPEKEEITLDFDLPDNIRKSYNELYRHFITWLDSQDEVVAESAAAQSQKMRQLVSGLVYVADGSTAIAHTVKEDLLLRHIDALQGDPALLVYEYTSERDYLATALARESIRVESFHSGLPGAEQRRIFDAWNKSKIPVLLCHSASLGEGSNLQDARNSCVIWYTLTWSARRFEQLNARLWRQGRKDPVRIYKLLGKHTIDERVDMLLRIKVNKQKKFLKKLAKR